MRNELHPHGGLRYARAAAVATKQWGCLTRRQLRGVGFTSREIEGLADRGLLTRLHRGVFAFGAPSRAPEQRWAAALLAAGKGSALSHTTAATSYGQLPVRDMIEVVAPTRRRGDERLRIRTPKRFEALTRNGLTVTSPAQTLLDLAATGWPIERMAHEMAAGGIASLSDLRAFAKQRRGEPGARALAAALAIPHTRSRRERAFERWLRDVGVPMPDMNDPIGPYTVDAHWPTHDLVIELDYEQTHGSAWARRQDQEEDAWLTATGKEVWRVRGWGPDLAERLRQRLT